MPLYHPRDRLFHGKSNATIDSICLGVAVGPKISITIIINGTLGSPSLELMTVRSPFRSFRTAAELSLLGLDRC